MVVAPQFPMSAAALLVQVLALALPCGAFADNTFVMVQAQVKLKPRNLLEPKKKHVPRSADDNFMMVQAQVRRKPPRLLEPKAEHAQGALPVGAVPQGAPSAPSPVEAWKQPAQPVHMEPSKADDTEIAKEAAQERSLLSRQGPLVEAAVRSTPSRAEACILAVAILGAAAVGVFALRFKTKQSFERPKKPDPPSSEMEAVLETGRGEEALPLAELPPPMRSLRNIGASYVVPHASLAKCCSDRLSFDMPTLPCVWPLRAMLSRPSQGGAWTKLQLTVDIIAASEMPPLLTCAPAAAPSRPQDCGETGGTGSTAVEAAGGGGDDGCAAPGCGEAAKEDGDRGEHSDAWLTISNAGGTEVATISHCRDGTCTVQRQDRSLWEIGIDLDTDAPRIIVYRQGQEIGQATSLGHGKPEHLQVDTQPDVQSPESAVLLMCMLAMLAFRP